MFSRLVALVLPIAIAAVSLTSCAPVVTPHGSTAGGAAIYAVPLSWSTAYLVVAPGGRVTLVDAGSDRPDDLAALGKAVASHGGWSALELIVLTHAHADHAGLADTLRALSGAAVMLGAADVALYRRGGTVDLQAIGLEARLIEGAVPESYSPPSRPDGLAIVPVDGRVSLGDYGLDGYVASVPGHTPGSVAVVLEDAAGKPAYAFVGDLVRGGSLGGRLRPGHARTHYFHEDRLGAEAAFAALAAAGVDTFFLGHGGPIDATEAARFVRRHAAPPNPHPRDTLAQD